MKAIATIRAIALTTFVSAFAACQPSTVRPPPAPVTAVDTTGAVRYLVDGAQSDLHILVYRGGAMARLGHNHVISSKNVGGVLLRHEDLARSRIELTLPVASLIVDDPQVRGTEGEEFAAEVPVDAREGTRRNLLREEVLDAAHHATITLQSIAMAGTHANPQITTRITIKGVSRDVSIPVTVKEGGELLTATGAFEIKQTDFGMTPFSVALGALQVQDRLRIKFSIVCRQQK